MTMILERIEQLIALATDAGATQEEARTAAHKACMLMREHKIVLATINEEGILQTLSKVGAKIRAEQARAAAASKVPHSERWRRGRVTHHCAGCGERTEDGGLCPECLARRAPPQKVWFVTCERCPRQTPQAHSEEVADRIALELGFRIIDGEVCCPYCVHAAANRGRRSARGG